MNTGVPWPTPQEAKARVLRMQTKLHRWAIDAPDRRFDDLYNLVHDPSFLTVAWVRVRGNRGARSAGVDGAAPRDVAPQTRTHLAVLREDLKTRRFVPMPVKERMIPKPGTTKRRRLGIPTTRDRIVQASLKLVLEPIFEADFKPCSYGFRPNRRAQDAIAEVHFLSSRSYVWIFEGDIEACFDEIDHTALTQRLRERIGDRRILRLVKAFLKAGVLTEDGADRATITGAPQGGILSPLLSNVALSVLDEHFTEKWVASGTSGQRYRDRKRGGATYRLVRYADDFVILVAGTRAHAEALRGEVTTVLAPMGLRLSATKTKIAHIDEGFDFLGFRIQRRNRKGTDRRVVYTYPSKKSLAAVKAKVRTLTNRSSHRTLHALLHRLNPVLQGWSMYFRHGVSKQTFDYLEWYTEERVMRWLKKRHPGLSWQTLKRRYLAHNEWGRRPAERGTTLFNVQKVTVSRYRYRGSRIPTPWTGK